MSYEDIVVAQKKRDAKMQLRPVGQDGKGSGKALTPHLWLSRGKSHVSQMSRRRIKKSKHWAWRGFVLYFDSEQDWAFRNMTPISWPA